MNFQHTLLSQTLFAMLAVTALAFIILVGICVANLQHSDWLNPNNSKGRPEDGDATGPDRSSTLVRYITSNALVILPPLFFVAIGLMVLLIVTGKPA